MVSKSSIKNQFDGGDELDFDAEFEEASIGCSRPHQNIVEIDHFTVASDYRRQGIASTIMRATIEYFRTHAEVTTLRTHIQLTDQERGDADSDREILMEDPTVQFLRSFGFEQFDFVEDRKWDTCVSAGRPV